MRPEFYKIRAWILPLPLSLTLLVTVLLPFLAVMGLTGWYSINLLERNSRDRMQEDIELIARAIRLPLSHALERGYEETIKRALESAFTIDRVYGVYVYDRRGKTIYASGAREPSMGSEQAVRIANRGEGQGEFARVGKEAVFSYFVPLVDAGEQISGLLQITRRGSDFDNYLSQLRTHSLSVLVVSAIILTLIILLGYRWTLGRHLAAVKSGLARIRSGEPQHRFDANGPREMQLLASGINEMLNAIAQSGEALAEQKDREAELTEKLHQSEKLAALGQLSAGVAHELGSPLSTVDGKAQRALRQGSSLPPVVINALESIRRESARMERIIRQLLDFGRANPLDCRSVPASQPLISALKRVEAPAHISVNQRLSPGVETLSVTVDLIRLEQALTNLLRNAFQAARSRVSVSCESCPEGIRYCFEDDGQGISDDILPHLFEPFFTTKPVGEGTGLGLAVAHAAVRDHGGIIEVSSTDSGGARFCLLLPQGVDAADV
jgi:signal transduction histidine kinase